MLLNQITRPVADMISMPAQPRAHFERVRACWRLIRAYEWWHYKLPLPLAIAYAVAWMNNLPFCMLIWPTVLILMAGLSTAIWASVFNDFMDEAQDRRAGKSTPMMQLSSARKWLVILSSVSLSVLTALVMRHYVSTLAVFLTILAIYTLYSLPPFRLKERGALGVFAIAIGEHVLAAVLALAVVAESTGATVKPLWVACLLVWSVAYGARGIIWHQLCDIDNDIKAGCKTLGTAIGARNLKQIGEHIVFPVEMFCLVALLLMSGNGLAWLLLGPYLLLEALRCKFLQQNIVIVSPRVNPRFIMLEYYQVFFPLAFLCSAWAQDINAVLLTAFYVLAFMAPFALLTHHVRLVAQRCMQRFRAGGFSFLKAPQ